MKLKTLIITLLFGIGLIGGCSDKTDFAPQQDLLNGTWNLKNLSVGFAGLDEDFSAETITWTFNSQNQTIIVNNNDTAASTKCFFDNGTYNYSIAKVSNQKYLNIDNDEYGGLTILTNTLTIDQNKISNGIGSRWFYSVF